MRALIAAADVPPRLRDALGALGIEPACLQPPRALVLAWRIARRAACASVPAKMSARAAFERGWSAYAAARIAKERPDFVVGDLAVGRSLLGVRRLDVLVLTRGTADGLHAALDAEAARSPTLAAHLTNFRASPDDCALERRVVHDAARVVALSSWIADTASDAGATDVAIVPPSLRAPAAPSACSAVRARSPSIVAKPTRAMDAANANALRVLVAGVLIGRHGARPMLDVARQLGRAIDVTFAGRVADERSAIARWAGHFRVTDAKTFDEALDAADVLAAPWVIDGRCREVEHALARGVPVVATRAAGIDTTTSGALVVEAGSTESLAAALVSLRDPSARAALSEASSDERAGRDEAQTSKRFAAALVDARGPSA